MTSRSTSSGRLVCCRTTPSWRRKTSRCRSRSRGSSRARWGVVWSYLEYLSHSFAQAAREVLKTDDKRPFFSAWLCSISQLLPYARVSLQYALVNMYSSMVALVQWTPVVRDTVKMNEESYWAFFVPWHCGCILWEPAGQLECSFSGHWGKNRATGGISSSYWEGLLDWNPSPPSGVSRGGKAVHHQPCLEWRRGADDLDQEDSRFTSRATCPPSRIGYKQWVVTEGTRSQAGIRWIDGIAWKEQWNNSTIVWRNLVLIDPASMIYLSVCFSPILELFTRPHWLAQKPMLYSWHTKLTVFIFLQSCQSRNSTQYSYCGNDFMNINFL